MNASSTNTNIAAIAELDKGLVPTVEERLTTIEDNIGTIMADLSEIRTVVATIGEQAGPILKSLEKSPILKMLGA